MEKGGFDKKDGSGEKWGGLIEYALTLPPVCDIAEIYRSETPAGIRVQRALTNLLVDTGRKLRDSKASTYYTPASPGPSSLVASPPSQPSVARVPPVVPAPSPALGKP